MTFSADDRAAARAACEQATEPEFVTPLGLGGRRLSRVEADARRITPEDERDLLRRLDEFDAVRARGEVEVRTRWMR